MKKLSPIVFPIGIFVVLLLVIATIFLVRSKNNEAKVSTENFLLGDKPEVITQGDDWLKFETEAPFTFAYPTSWGIEAVAGSNGQNGVHAVGPEGEVFMYWGNGFGGACEPNNMKELQLKEEKLTVCNEVNSDGSEGWRLISKQINAEVGFDARAQANSPAEKNRAMILGVLSTISFKK